MICFVGMSIFKFQYTLLISVVVAVTNVIPIFGPFIGAIPSICLLLLVDPMQAVWFTIFIIVLQQIDGNVIGPKVVGDSIGLPAWWVMVSILIGGGFLGVFGMLAGVPTFAVIYKMLKKSIHYRLEKKGLEHRESKDE
jgi:predicted PurR-regulated permease PerM